MGETHRCGELAVSSVLIFRGDRAAMAEVCHCGEVVRFLRAGRRWAALAQKARAAVQAAGGP